MFKNIECLRGEADAPLTPNGASPEGSGAAPSENGGEGQIRAAHERLAYRLSQVEQERAVIDVHMRLIHMLFRRIWQVQNDIAALKGQPNVPPDQNGIS